MKRLWRWWTLHPWRAFWINAVAGPVVLLGFFLGLGMLANQPLIVLLELYGGLALIGLVAVLWFLTAFVGVRSTARRSRVRAAWFGVAFAVWNLAVVAVAIPLYANVGTRAGAAKAQADARTLGSAVSMYSATFGTLPRDLAELTSAMTISGISGGPFTKSIPTPPAGWTGYRYSVGTDGTWTITATGDGTTVSVP